MDVQKLVQIENKRDFQVEKGVENHGFNLKHITKAWVTFSLNWSSVWMVWIV